MSGSKSGDIGLSPILILCGAPVVLAVVGTAYVIGGAVTAYINARDKINHDREQAMREQRENVNRLMNTWKEKLAATEQKTASPIIRSVKESLAGMPSTGPITISSYAADELKGYISEQIIEVPSPNDDKWRTAELKRCQDVISCMEDIVRSMKEALPDDLATRLSDLNQINDAQELSERALEIRMGINKEVQRIQRNRDEDKAKASRMLETLPEDCPPEARKSFQEAADGNSPLTDELQQLFKGLKQTQQKRALEQKEVDIKNREIASKVLQSTLEEMGYQVGCVNSNLLAIGSEAFIRNDSWDEGYCVNIRIVKDRIHFKAEKDGDSNNEHDASMERAWESEFQNVTERLKKSGISIIDYSVGSKPGETPVRLNKKIPINTKKKGTTSPPADATSTAGSTGTAAKAHQYATRGSTP